MSGAVQSLSWAMSVRGIDASSFRVLIALVNRANHSTGECFPSHRRIAEDTEMSVATVKRVIDRLVERELLTVHRQTRENGSKTSNRYRLTIAQNELPIAQNELSPQVTGELSITSNNKHSSEPKGSSEGRARPKTDFEHGGLTTGEALAWARPDMGWTDAQAFYEWTRFQDDAEANSRRYSNWMAAWRKWCRSPYCKTVGVKAAMAAHRAEPLRV
jgi:DNA-binding transcriptional regulator YhcF (GntR family)